MEGVFCRKNVLGESHGVRAKASVGVVIHCPAWLVPSVFLIVFHLFFWIGLHLVGSAYCECLLSVGWMLSRATISSLQLLAFDDTMLPSERVSKATWSLHRMIAMLLHDEMRTGEFACGQGKLMWAHCDYEDSIHHPPTSMSTVTAWEDDILSLDRSVQQFAESHEAPVKRDSRLSRHGVCPGRRRPSSSYAHFMVQR